MWSAEASADGTKIGAGNFTSRRTSEGEYSVQWNVAGLGLPFGGYAPRAVVTPKQTCGDAYVSATVSSGGFNGVLGSFTANVTINNPGGDPKDCAFMVIATVPDPDVIDPPLGGS